MEETNAAPPAAHAFLFNQYYFDLLKRCKDVAKQDKETSRDARNVLRAIKKHYRSYDSMSREHFDAWCEGNRELAAGYLAADADAFDGFLASQAALAAPWYKDITFNMVAKMQPNAFNLHQYWTLFGILATGELGESASKVVDALRAIADAAKYEAAVAELPDGVRAPLMRLRAVFDASKAPPGIDLSGIEDTSLGRLAKEILEDPAVQEIQESMKDATGMADMFSGDGAGGIVKLMSTVSQKMMSKLATGEIKQENLLDDAMKFASKLQGMVPGNLMGDLMGMAGGMGGGGAGGFDMSSLMGMLGGMNRKQKKRAASAATSAAANETGSGARRSHRRHGSSHTRDSLRKKLDAQRKKSEAQVE
jgi:hypothetical protein